MLRIHCDDPNRESSDQGFVDVGVEKLKEGRQSGRYVLYFAVSCRNRTSESRVGTILSSSS